MKNTLKRVMLLTLVLSLVFSLVACGGNSSSDSKGNATDDEQSGTQSENTGAEASSGEIDPEKDKLVYCINFAEPGTYNSWKAGATLAAGPVLAAVMEPLMENVNGEWNYVLATDYEMIDDLTVQVHIRDNVYFHNGEKMTAEDVAYSTELAMNSVTGAATWAFVDSCEVVDPLTVQYNLKYQSSGFNNALASVSVTSKAYFEEVGHEGFALHPMGTDYYMWDEYVPGDTVILKANENYWSDHGTIKTLQFRFIQETSQALIELENGNVDVISADGSTLTSIEGNDAMHVEIIRDFIVEYLGFNFNSEKMQDIRVRQAIAHAINREEINIGAREGLCEVADSFMVPGHGEKYNPEAANYYDYNLEKAKELMTEAGYSESNPLKVKLMTDTQPQRALEAQQIKNMLDKVYFNVEIQTFEAAAFNDILMGGDPSWYDMLIRGVGVQLGNPIMQLYTICSIDATEGKTNPMWLKADSHPKAQEFNDLLKQALATMDPEAEIPIVHQLQLIDREICGEVWLFNRVSYFAMTSDLHLVGRGKDLDTSRAYFVK